MEHGLANKKVALLEARMGGELADLVKRRGGEPHNFPALRETTRDASVEVDALINALNNHQFSFIIFQTGVGVSSLFAEAERLGRLKELLDRLQYVVKVCRGPKPAAVLARRGLRPDISAPSPFTTANLLDVLDHATMRGEGVLLLHYGERNKELTRGLLARGAELHELMLYEWHLPEDTTPLTNLIAALPRGEFAAVAFTSQIQARHLFQIAEEIGEAEALREALNHRTVTASIGPTCSAALRALGVEPRIEPEIPKMGHLVIAINQYLANAN